MNFVTWDLHDLTVPPAWRGAIDYMDGERIRGWAISARQVGEAVSLEVRVCGVALPAMACDVARDDIAHLFDVPVRAGFDIPFSSLPPEIAAALLRALPAPSHSTQVGDVLEIRLGGTELMLPFSPGVAGQTLPQSHLRQSLEAVMAAQAQPAPAPEDRLEVIALLDRDLAPFAQVGTRRDWTQIAAAPALYAGHVQPRLPAAEIGFYDSRCRETLLAQIKQARAHGVTGFCYRHQGAWDEASLHDGQAWQQHLDGAADFGFCLHWHLEAERAAEQAKTFATALRFLTAPCYIRLAGLPLLLVSGLEHLSDPAPTLAVWRAALRGAGALGLHICLVETATLSDPLKVGCDSSCQLFPEAPALETARPAILRRAFGDYAGLVTAGLTAPPPAHLRLGCALPGFDDSPIHGADAKIWQGATPALFAAWVCHLAQAARLGPAAGRAIFLNAWNGWAWGACLEPDQSSGPALQEALRDALAASAFGTAMPDMAISEAGMRRQIAGLIRTNAALTALLQRRVTTAASDDAPEDRGGFVAAPSALLRVNRHPEGRAQLDLVNGHAPMGGLLPVPISGGLALAGWVGLPETDPFPGLISLRDGQGHRHVALLRHALPMADQTSGFRFRGQLQAVPPGRYQLEFLRPDRKDPGLALAVDLNCEILIG